MNLDRVPSEKCLRIIFTCIVSSLCLHLSVTLTNLHSLGNFSRSSVHKKIVNSSINVCKFRNKTSAQPQILCRRRDMSTFAMMSMFAIAFLLSFVYRCILETLGKFPYKLIKHYWRVNSLGRSSINSERTSQLTDCCHFKIYINFLFVFYSLDIKESQTS